MPKCDPDQKKPVDGQADLTIAQKVEALRKHVERMRVVYDDKAFMDEGWGE